MPKKKNQIREVLATDVHWVLDGDIDAAILVLKNLKKTHSKTHHSLQLEFDYNYDYYGGDRSTMWVLIGFRDETKTERTKRLAQAKAIRTTEKARDMTELARLQKKYKS